MQPIAKSVKRQVRSTESSHIVNTTIRLSHNAVLTGHYMSELYINIGHTCTCFTQGSSGWPWSARLMRTLLRYLEQSSQAENLLALQEHLLLTILHCLLGARLACQDRLARFMNFSLQAPNFPPRGARRQEMGGGKGRSSGPVRPANSTWRVEES